MEATQKKNKYEIDMCNGTIMDKLISFALPLMVSSILQLLFNAVDIIVVGRFTGSQALAAVGSTTALINMFVNLFIGVSLGANVLSARFYAAGKEREMSETVHTAMTFALISGIVMVFVGLFCTRGALELMDTHIAGQPKMIDRETFFKGIEKTSTKPFRVVPFFDPAPWGGQWMKEVCDLDRSKQNYGWCFDCVPEENSLYFEVNGVRFELPSVDLVLLKSKELLGEPVEARFGKDFPIRFDFLDTIGGGNLSLQVHPTTQFIRENFGMYYTQDESYYLLDAEEDAVVYLGVKNGVDREAMIEDLRRAQRGEIVFDAEKYVNKIPAKKHDHFLIPGGTIHCSGSNSMVLEISSTPNLFTFKLWDWQRLGLDGKPRPINVERGKHVINWNRNTDYVYRKTS